MAKKVVVKVGDTIWYQDDKDNYHEVVLDYIGKRYAIGHSVTGDDTFSIDTWNVDNGMFEVTFKEGTR